MSTYAIGDIQGCYSALRCLLDKIAFDPSKDRLWLAGDLVSRGPDSLDTLRFLKNLGDSVTFVLGNHDLHLLALAEGIRQPHPGDALEPVLNAPDRDELLDWLRHGKVLHQDKRLGFVMVHAGIPPQWSLSQAVAHARELEAVLHSPHYRDFLANMYGNQPNRWKNKLIGYDRLRVITNYFTRMRFCTEKGEMEFATKTGALDAPPGFAPWFVHPLRKTRDHRILFGHWAALEGKVDTPSVFALDTGCVWGGSLSALRLEDETWFRCQCAPAPQAE